MKKFIDKAKAIVLGKESGKIELGHGQNKVFIPTYITPKNVHVNFKDIEVPNCSGITSDSFDISISEKGFTITFKINSNKRIIEWTAKAR